MPNPSGVGAAEATEVDVVEVVDVGGAVEIVLIDPTHRVTGVPPKSCIKISSWQAKMSPSESVMVYE